MTAESEILRRLASGHGATARQRTVRQETTMSKRGTLPDFVLYQQQLIVGERVTLNFRFDENEHVNEDYESNQSEDGGESDKNDETDDFDESNCEEVDLSVTVASAVLIDLNKMSSSLKASKMEKLHVLINLSTRYI